jgi:SnoaL-like domain
VSCVPQAVLEAADVSAVTQLILRERLSRDLGLWEQMRDCFHDDSVVRISWINASGPEFVRRSKEMAERNVQASHRLGPILVTLAGDRAIAQLVTIIDIPFKLEGIEVMLSSHTRLLLRAERREGVWRLAGKGASLDSARLDPLLRSRTDQSLSHAATAWRLEFGAGCAPKDSALAVHVSERDLEILAAAAHERGISAGSLAALITHHAAESRIIDAILDDAKP